MSNVENEARDSHGRWTTGGSGANTTVDPRVAKVETGDEWNRKTAARLENEYAAQRPALDKLAHEAVGKTVDVQEPNWDSLTSVQQGTIEKQFQDANFDTEYQNEVQNWAENSAKDDAATKVALNGDWKAETLHDILEDREEKGLPHIPYTPEQLLSAFGVDFHGSTRLSWNEGAQKDLTQEMRDGVEKDFKKAFEDKLSEVIGDMEPPDYLSENVHDSLATSWDNMNNAEKMTWAKDSGNWDATANKIALPEHFDPLQQMGQNEPFAQYERRTDEDRANDYRNTQLIAHEVATERALQLMKERGISAEAPARLIQLNTPAGDYSGKWTWVGWGPGSATVPLSAQYNSRDEAQAHEPPHVPASITAQDIHTADSSLWSGWKASSTGQDGQILQLAAADELGGRVRDASAVRQEPGKSVDKFEMPKDGMVNFIGQGPLAGGTYKTDLNDPKHKIGDTMTLSSGMQIQKQALGGWQYTGTGSFTPKLNTTAKQVSTEDGYLFNKLPDVTLMRNGLSSWTTDRAVANQWEGTGNKVPSGIDRKETIDRANRAYADVGGYDGIKAMTRAKWETTQYMLDRANEPEVDLFRGVMLTHTFPLEPGTNTPSSAHVGSEIYKAQGAFAQAQITAAEKLAKINLGELAAHGQPTIPSNTKTESRVVMRASVPRTAILSVPAYGINEASEHEVVVAGTAWHNWDAWSYKAPSFEGVPLADRPKNEKTT